MKKLSKYILYPFVFIYVWINSLINKRIRKERLINAIREANYLHNKNKFKVYYVIPVADTFKIVDKEGRRAINLLLKDKGHRQLSLSEFEQIAVYKTIRGL